MSHLFPWLVYFPLIYLFIFIFICILIHKCIYFNSFIYLFVNSDNLLMWNVWVGVVFVPLWLVMAVVRATHGIVYQGKKTKPTYLIELTDAAVQSQRGWTPWPQQPFIKFACHSTRQGRSSSCTASWVVIIVCLTRLNASVKFITSIVTAVVHLRFL